ncbi:receptor-type tyrosine-protein phosphatase eta [Simochromis diagramma]|uniref:receptor-type tyrosine-protein phosphatase eta n=1 Tax=Simochromis diagramma TaxID=43689 RepID=UPI001A7E9A5C|nr:receptor-type tyrosine-protein phosphatase eta [Simochromis diagramma]
MNKTVTETKVNVTELTPGVNYTFTVTAVAGDNSTQSVVATLSQYTEPEVVTSLSAVNVTTSSIFVSWTKPVGSSSFYKVQWTDGGTSASFNVSETFYNIINLTAGVQYEVNVTAVAGDGSTEGQSATVTNYTKPEKVNDLNVSEITTSSIFLNWTEPLGQRSFYRVEWTDGTINMNKTETKVNVTELTPGVNYTFTVTAVAGDNNTQSDVATLSQYTKPEKVNDLTVSEIRTSSIFLNWTEPQGQRSFYRVEWTNGTINMNKTVTETKVNVTELTPGVNYTFTVIAVAGDNSTQSDVATLSQYTESEVVMRLSAVNVTTSSIFVSWTKPVGNSSFYKVQWTDGGTNFSVNVNVTSYTITNLTAGVQYEINVTAVADDNYTEGQSATVTIYTKPEKVNDLNVNEIRTSSIFLNWTEPQGQRSFYRVEWTDGTINMNKTVTETKVNVTELTPGVNYTFTVIAVAGDNNTQSGVATLSQYTKPEKVNDLTVSEIRTSSIFLNWTEPQGQRSFYRVEWTDGTINMNKTVTETKVNVTELTPGVNYTFTVIAVAGDNSTQSVVATLSQYTKPEVVTSLSVVNVTTSSVFVSWTKPVGNSSFYKVQWTGGGTSASVTVNDTFKNIINLTAGVQYEVNVTAVAGDGSTEGQSATVTNYTKPEVVTSLSVVNVTTSSIFVSWTKPVGSSSFYKVQWTGGETSASFNVNETFYNIINLTAGVQYEVNVTAVAGDGSTEGQSATVTNYTKPEKVNDLTVSEIRTSSIFLNWTEPQGQRSFYRVEWTDGTINMNKTVTETKVNVTELTPGVNYTFTVIAVAGDNRTESDVATLSQYTKPEKVNDLTVSEIRTSSIFLNWTEPQGQRSFYRVEWTDGTINMNKTVTETKVNVTELTPGVNYTFTVTAVAGDNSTQSVVATLSQYTKPEVVTSLSAVNVTTSSIFVSWTKPVGKQLLL